MSHRSEPIDAEAAVDLLWDLAPKYAKAKAERVYLEEYRKSVKAILMKKHADLPLGAQEREAYADDTYLGNLNAIRIAVEAEETLRWQLVSAQAAIDVWRSQNASNRQIDRATQ
jgi:hypothetical protein